MDELTRLAHAARLGRPRALDAFVRESYADVWRMCSALVDDQAADDLAQETCLRATRALPQFRGEASARTWVLAIARRVCMDELRTRDRQRRRQRRLLATAERSASAPDPADEVAADQLLSLLDTDRRAAFVLTQMFRLSYEETAAICECPAGTIRSRVARARDDLIAALNAQKGDGQRPRAHTTD